MIAHGLEFSVAEDHGEIQLASYEAAKDRWVHVGLG